MMKPSVVFFGKLIVFLLLLSQSILIPFFPLYLKYLNFSLLQMGVIRALMVWIPIVLTPISITAIKKITSNITRRVCISGSIFTTLTICICLIFVAPIEHPKTVTHCKTTSEHIGPQYNMKIKTHSTLKNFSEPMTFNMWPENNTTNNQDYNESLRILKNNPSVSQTMISLSRNESSQQVQLITEKSNHTEGIKRVETNFAHTTHYIEKPRALYKSGKYFKAKKKRIDKNMDDKDEEMQNFAKISQTDQQGVDVKDSYKTLFPYFNLHKKSGRKTLNLANLQPRIDDTQRERNVEAYDMNYRNDKFKKQETLKSNIHHYKRVKETKIRDSRMEGKIYEKIPGTTRYTKSKNGQKELSHTDSINKSQNMHMENDLSIQVNNQLLEKEIQNKQNDAYDLGEQQLVNGPHVVEKENSQGSHTFHSSVEQVFGSETFFTVLILSLLYAILFSCFVPWTEVLCYYNLDEYTYEHLFIFQIFIFKSPGLILSYPIVSFLTTISPCPYQIVMHPFMGVIVLVSAFIAALLFLLLKYPETKYFRSRKPSKPLHSEKYLTQHSFYKFFSAVTNLLFGMCIASQAEFVLWKAETLEGFPFNYEYLYCGYFCINALSYICMDRYLQYQKQKNDNSYDEEDSEDEESVVHFSYEWFMNTKHIIYTEHQKSNLHIILGTFLLSATLFATSISSAWFLLPIAFLKGLADATIESAIPEGNWMLVLFGYGLGCVAGSLTSNFLGIDILFYVSSTCMFICFVGWFIYSVLYWLLFSPLKGKERNQRHYMYYSI